MRSLCRFMLAVTIATVWFAAPDTAGAQTTPNLTGIWYAKKRFGPDVRGTLMLRQNGDVWRAEIAGFTVEPSIEGDAIKFELPGGNGRFVGSFDSRRATVKGHWFQAISRYTTGMSFASPVTLSKIGRDWRGEVVPLDEELTFYIVVSERPDGTLGAFLRNPERNLGRFIRVDRIERDGDKVKLVGAPTASEAGRVWAEGTFRNDILTIDLGGRGYNYDFTRLDPNETTDFYSRGRPGIKYSYSHPPELNDGWPTATLEEVGISRAAIEKFIQGIIDAPVNTLGSQQDHGILIVRHGKLVLEEYFHGEHREKPHDTRSASKSIAADMMGAVMHTGVKLNAPTPVYNAMNGGEFPADIEPRKRAMTMESLLTMSSGLDCDESNPESPGFEDRMWEQTEQPDFYKWTMALKMVRDPGEKAVYCSASSNLVGGVVARLAKRSGQVLFHELLAEPLQIRHYFLTTSPLGDFSQTGGSRFYPRDFLKLAQVHLNDGMWKGRRIYSSEWAKRSTTPLYQLPSYDLRYGYLWWVKEYPYKGRTVRGYFASGNGGQIAMAIPELDLALGFWAGNYNDVGGRKATNEYVPQYILPAVVK